MENFLITGITGQDGLFLTAKLLELNKNCNIFGISRSNNNKIFFNRLNSLTNSSTENLKLFKVDLEDITEVNNFISKIKPSHIINLSGPSSVYESLVDYSYTKKSIEVIFDNLINTCIKQKIFPVFFQASSSEMFGNNNGEPLNENSEFNPNSPYAEAKLRNHLKLINLAKQNDWNLTSGIMFNHESEFRESNYLFKKTILTAIAIHSGKKEILKIGSLDYIRDWSFAGDVANAIYKIIFSNFENSYVIGSGIPNSIEDLISVVFEHFGLNWNMYVNVDEQLLRKGDPKTIIANPKKIKVNLDWQPKYSFNQLVSRCIEKELI